MLHLMGPSSEPPHALDGQYVEKMETLKMETLKMETLPLALSPTVTIYTISVLVAVILDT